MATHFKAELVACFGQPVDENPTGVMQEAAFRATGLDWRYLTVEVAAADADRDVLHGRPGRCCALAGHDGPASACGPIRRVARLQAR